MYEDDNEYHKYLHDPDWTKGETDQLLEMAKRFELRWPVIYDRWCTHFDYDEIPHNRRIEDLQARYYTVAAILMQRRIVTEAAHETHSLQAQANEALKAENEEANRATTDTLLIESAAAKLLATSDPKHQPLMSNLGTGSTNKPVFDLKYERERRAHQELLWKRTKEEDEEEAKLRKELKEVETQLRKLKKAGAHVAASKRSVRGTSASAPEVTPETIQTAFAAMSPTPMPGTPYLQSARLVPPTPGAGVNKNLLGRMKEILQEMKVPETPIPTKRVCDLYDSVRRDILSLLVLQKSVLQKEGLLQSKRLVVNKKGGNIQVPDEETLLGIERITVPPAAAAVPPDSQTVSAMKSTGQGNKTPRVGGKTPRSTASNKSGSISDSRKGIPAVISTGNPDESASAQVVVTGNANQGKQAKKAVAPKRKRKSIDASENTDPPPVATEVSSSPATQKATDPANPPKSSGKKRQKKAEKTTKEAS